MPRHVVSCVITRRLAAHFSNCGSIPFRLLQPV